MKSGPQLRRKTILLGLSLHFALWWTWLSVSDMRGSSWGSTWQHRLEIGWSAVTDQVISPFTFGPTFMTRLEFLGWAALRVSITIALLTMAYFAVTRQRRRTVVLAHCTVLVYWVASMIIFLSEVIAEAKSF